MKHTIWSLLLAAGSAATVAAPGTATGNPDASAVYERSYSLEASLSYTQARAVLEKLPPRMRATYTYELRRAWLAYLAGNYETAIDDYSSAIRREPKAVEPRIGLMLPQMALRRWLDAVKVGKDVLKLDPNNYYALSRTAYALFNLGRYKDAEHHYRKTLQLYPSDVEMQSGLAWSLLKQGQRAAAEKMFREIVLLAPRYASAQQGLRAAAP